MDEDLQSYSRISISFHEITSLRGHPSPYQVEYRHASHNASYTAVFLPIHALTHLEFPWKEDRDPELLNSYSRPLKVRAVILDFTAKQKALERYLIHDHGLLKGYYPYLDQAQLLTGDVLWLLIEELEIAYKEIEEKLSAVGNPDLSTTVLLFRTDWTVFNLYSANFNNPALEGIAAFLCHPFISKATIEKLLQRGAIGIGHDLPSFENPLFYARGQGALPIVQQALEIAKEEWLTQGYEDYPLGERFMHAYFLRLAGKGRSEMKRYYIKNLRFIELPSAKQKTLGSLVLVPVQVLRDAEGIACEAFFKWMPE